LPLTHVQLPAGGPAGSLPAPAPYAASIKQPAPRRVHQPLDALPMNLFTQQQQSTHDLTWPAQDPAAPSVAALEQALPPRMGASGCPRPRLVPDRKVYRGLPISSDDTQRVFMHVHALAHQISG